MTLVTFGFMVNFEQFRKWIREACFVTFTFSLIVTLYLKKKNENKTKKSLTQLLYLFLDDIGTKSTFSEATYVCLLTYKI